MGETAQKRRCGDFPGGKTSPCKAGDVGLIPGWRTRIPHVAQSSRKIIIKEHRSFLLSLRNCLATNLFFFFFPAMAEYTDFDIDYKIELEPQF